MSLAAALVLIAQSAAPNAADAPAARTTPVATTATASARVLRPARISVREQAEVTSAGEGGTANVQQARDAAGTLWIEFS